MTHYPITQTQLARLPYLAVLASLLFSSTLPAQLPVESRSNIDVHGTVIFPDGKPVTDARVYLYRRDSYVSGAILWPIETIQACTDAAGRFQFNSIRPGAFILWAESEHWTSLGGKVFSGKKIIRYRDHRNAIDEQIQLQPASQYVFEVLDEITSVPISNATVESCVAETDHRFITNEQGIVSSTSLSSRDWKFKVSAAGYVTRILQFQPIAPGQSRKETIRLVESARLMGVVVDSRGGPIHNAQVTCSLVPDVYTTLIAVQTAVDGKWEVNCMPSGGEVSIAVSARGYKDKSLVINRSAENLNDELQLKMEEKEYGGNCRVTVIDENNQPIANARVVSPPVIQALDTRAAFTDDLGQATLADLPIFGDMFRAAVEAEGYETQSFELIPGSAEEPGQVTIVMSEGVEISGVVLNELRQPISGVIVECRSPGDIMGKHEWVYTDEEGRYSFRHKSYNSYLQIRANQRYQPLASISVHSGQADEIVLQEWPILRVTPVDADNSAPVANARLWMVPQAGAELLVSVTEVSPGSLRDISVEPHEFLVTGVTSDRKVDLKLIAPHYHPAFLIHTIGDSVGLEDHVVIPMRRIEDNELRSISGRIVMGDGTPVAAAKLSVVVHGIGPAELMKLDQRLRRVASYHWNSFLADRIDKSFDCLAFQSVSADEQGAFQFEPLVVADWTEIFYSGTGIAPARLMLPPNSDAVALASLKITVEPESRLRIYASPEFDGNWWCKIQSGEAKTDPFAVIVNKTFELTTATFVDIGSLPAGTYRLFAGQKNEGAAWSRSITIAAGESIELETREGPSGSP